jgi:hypothetical protein
MKIIDNRPHRRVPRCNICKKNIEWRLINGKYVAYLLDGTRDTCYQLKK